MDYPLVSAVMPTCNRREFIPRAVRCFLSQDYPNLEWIILEDGGLDSIRDLLPDDPRIKYTHNPSVKYNHGTKCNICCEQATGEFIIVHDDDDFYPPNRVTRQIMPLIADRTLAVSGTSTLYYYRHGEQRAWRYTSPASVGWLASIAFRKDEWQRQKFDHIVSGADYNFIRKVPEGARHDLHDPSLVVASIHDTNACPKNLGSGYTPILWEVIERLWQNPSVDSVAR